MSCCWMAEDSRSPREKYKLTAAQAKQLGNIQQSLHFTDRQIAKLYRKFIDCDYDKNGTVDRREFLAWVDEPSDNGSFASKCFSLNDHDKSATMDFMEFIGVVYNFCSMDQEKLCKFAFRLVDKDDSGHLEMHELEEIVHLVYGTHLSASENGVYKSRNMTNVRNAMTVLKNLDKDKSGDVSFGEFSQCVRSHPMLLFPAFQLQEKVRKRAGGVRFWVDAVKTRQMSSEHDVDILDNLRAIERKDSCSEIQEKKSKRKEYRDKRQAQGKFGPKERKIRKKIDPSSRPGLTRKSSFDKLRELTRRNPRPPGLTRKSSFDRIRDFTKVRARLKKNSRVETTEGSHGPWNTEGGLNVKNIRKKTK